MVSPSLLSTWYSSCSFAYYFRHNPRSPRSHFPSAFRRQFKSTNHQFEPYRSATQQTRSRPRNLPEPVVPIFVSPSRTHVKQPRQSTDGNSRAHSLIWIMSSITRRQCPWDGMRGAQEEAHRVSCVSNSWMKWGCWNIPPAEGRTVEKCGEIFPPPSLIHTKRVRKYLITPLSRKAIWCLSCSLACQIRGISPRSSKKRGSKRRHQRPWHRQPHCEAHSSQPGAQTASPYLSRSWSRQSLFSLSLHRTSKID